MTRFALLVSLLLVFIGEACGEICRLHMLEDAAEGTTTGEKLFYFLFFPYTTPDVVDPNLCDTPPSNHWMSLDNLSISSFTPDIDSSWIVPWLCCNMTVVLIAFTNVRMARDLPQHRVIARGNVCAHQTRRKFKCRNEDEKRDKLRFLKVQRNKSDIRHKLSHLHQTNHSSGSFGKLEVNGQAAFRHQTAFLRLRRRYSVDKVPRHIIMDLLDAGTLRQKQHGLIDGRENSFRDVRQETIETLLKRKYDDERIFMSPEVVDGNAGGGGGGDFVEGANVHNIGRPCASSSFISAFDVEATAPVQIDNNEEDFVIENNGNLSRDSSTLRRNLEHEDETNESSITHQDNGSNRTHPSFEWFPNYFANTPDNTMVTSYDVGTDLSTMYDVPGDESSLMTTMMDSFASVSDNLQKTSTWYGSDDMEASLFQWLSAAMVTRGLVKKVWTFVFGQPDPNPVNSPTRDSPPMNESATTPPFRPRSQQYYSDFQSEFLRQEMID
ncbi:uncharacterized protein [Argopecten irradians]|uniref:uncharacterized protein n=1 Tax=Argopecten irradians TaxID=31199 RepID=UPI00371A7965